MEKQEEKESELERLGSAKTEGSDGNFYCLSIIGEIEGHVILDPSRKSTKYEHLLPLLFSLEEDAETDGIFAFAQHAGR